MKLKRGNETYSVVKRSLVELPREFQRNSGIKSWKFHRVLKAKQKEFKSGEENKMLLKIKFIDILLSAMFVSIWYNAYCAGLIREIFKIIGAAVMLAGVFIFIVLLKNSSIKLPLLRSWMLFFLSMAVLAGLWFLCSYLSQPVIKRFFKIEHLSFLERIIAGGTSVFRFIIWNFIVGIVTTTIPNLTYEALYDGSLTEKLCIWFLDLIGFKIKLF